MKWSTIKQTEDERVLGVEHGGVKYTVTFRVKQHFTHGLIIRDHTDISGKPELSLEMSKALFPYGNGITTLNDAKATLERLILVQDAKEYIEASLDACYRGMQKDLGIKSGDITPALQAKQDICVQSLAVTMAEVLKHQMGWA